MSGQTVVPVNGSTAVSVNSTVVLTFNEAIDAATVNINTIVISASGFSGQLTGSYTLDTTGTGADLTPPSVTTVSPANGATGVPTNSVILVQFSKRVDPLTVTTADFIVFPQATSISIPGTVAVSADGLSATFTPTSPLSPSTGYFIEATGNILDLEGQGLQSVFTSFSTQ